MERILVIGGSGMLSGLCDYYYQKGKEVTILSRTDTKAAFKTDKYRWIQCDYTTDGFRDEINKYFQCGGVEEVIIWMHKDGEVNFNWLMGFLKDITTVIRHIRGSRAYNERLKEEHDYGEYYFQYILGQVKELNAYRWHTNDEISKGVIKGIESGKKCFLVGNFDNI